MTATRNRLKQILPPVWKKSAVFVRQLRFLLSSGTKRLPPSPTILATLTVVTVSGSMEATRTPPCFLPESNSIMLKQPRRFSSNPSLLQPNIAAKPMQIPWRAHRTCFFEGLVNCLHSSFIHIMSFSVHLFGKGVCGMRLRTCLALPENAPLIWLGLKSLHTSHKDSCAAVCFQNRLWMARVYFIENFRVPICILQNRLQRPND